MLYAAFYILTALAAVTYYRRRIFSNAWDAMLVGVLPVGACVFLGWILVKSLLVAPGSQVWSIVGIVGVGIVLILRRRYSVLQSPFFFHVERETAPREIGR